MRKKNTVNTLLNFLLVIASLLLIAFISELGVRVLYFRKESATLEEAVRLGKLGGGPRHKEFLSHNPAALAHIIRLSSNPKIIYELLPDISAYSHEVWVKTNRFGFRDKEYSVSKTEDDFRIVGIGDSVMYGQGASEDSLYLNVLEYNLNNKNGKNIQIINMAVPGYNTVMEVETLKEKGLNFDPDIVVLGFVNNDFCLPNFIREKDDYFTLKKSYLFDLIKNRGEILFRSTKNVRHTSFLQNADFNICNEYEAPEEYRSMVGESAVIDALKELSQISQNNRFKVIVFFWLNSSDNVVNAAKKFGFYVLEIDEKLEKYMKDNNITDFMHSNLTVSTTDGHPSNAMHRLIAQWLQEFIEQNNILDTTNARQENSEKNAN